MEGIGQIKNQPILLLGNAMGPANDMLRETKEDDIRGRAVQYHQECCILIRSVFSTILDFKQVEFSESKDKRCKT